MMSSSLRQFLEEIEVERIGEPVSTELRIADYLRRFRKPVMFENIEGYPGYRGIGNLCYSREVIAKALKIDLNSLIEKLASALDRPISYGYTNNAPFLENHEDNPNLKEIIPLAIFHEKCRRYYTTGTIVLAREPPDGRMNASFHRLMWIGENRFTIRLVPRDLYRFYTWNKEHGMDTRVAVVCGVHPAICLAAATSYPDLNELSYARVFYEFKCIKIDGLDIPVDAEFVMMGSILHDEESEEGPFIDITGTWDKVRMQPVLEVDRVYWRSDPIWHFILPGGVEHKLLMGLPQEPRIYKIVRNTVPNVRKVYLTPGGCSWLHAIISIDKRNEGEGVNAGLAALAAHPSLKLVVVVDPDINVYDPEEVEWALATRLQPDRGVHIVRGAHGSSLDPSTSKTGLTSKWIIDATLPMDARKEDYRREW
ncbi:MAG: UbiD family decarboxylase [Nitrososphaerota archaeon]|nr:UbiD family decarboxylase [Candidatus Bathyarchaeota archaeon]MCX8162539.1 UbiD family decarboxylase [Candidatus Bathyarchaeota archaeon]MDW8061803.1 UbiD family decarboxylase [Nitrososphaerota archaeon]